MSLPRPIAAFISLAVVGTGFIAPHLAYLRGGTELELSPHLVAEQERVARLWIPPPESSELELSVAPPLDALADARDALEPDSAEQPDPTEATEAIGAPLAEQDQEVQEPGDRELGLGRIDGLPFEALTRAPIGTARGNPLADGLGGPGDNTEHVRRTRAPRKAPKTYSRNCEPERSDIFRVTDTSYRVEEEAIYYYANHPKEAEKLAATWWAKDDEGERRGFKVGRIKCGTLLDQAGFNSGDIVLAVNGREIESYSAAMGAFLSLRNRKVLWVDVERKGAPVRLDYHLVELGTATVPEGDEIVDPTALVDAELADPNLADRFESWGDRREDRKEERAERKEQRQEGESKKRWWR